MHGTHPPADEELLQQVHWIRGLAQAILRDHALAQDVSQEVLLRAITGERRSGRVLRAWLAAVTRNTSRSVLRERKRRVERERRSARPEAMPAPRDPAEALEAHHALTRAIGRLPSDARRIVLLRYFEDLGFPEIAERLGVSENAARVRLHRALGLLRAELAREGGDWQALCMQALPVGTLLGSSVTSSLAQLAIMKGFKSTLLGVAALLLLLLAYSQLGTEEAPEPELVASSFDTPREQIAQPDLAPAATEVPAVQRAEVMPAEPVGTWSLRGRASLPGDAPAAHTKVAAVLHDGYDADCPVLAERILECDSEGRFAWHLEPPANAVFLTLRPEVARGYGDHRLVLRSEAPPQDLHVTILRYGLPVRGTVRNEALEPIVGATVLGGAEPATTNDQGAFVLQGLLDLNDVTLYARAEGYAQEQRNLTVIPDREQLADFTLTRELVVHGRVLDEQGAPVEGAEVTSFRAMNLVVTSGKDGSYELRHLSPQESKHNVYARKEGYCEASATIAVESRWRVEQDLILRRGARVEGRVIGADGTALEGVGLYIGFSPSAYNRLNAVTHQDGKFRFPNVHPGQQTLVVQHPRFPELRMVLEIPEDAPEVSGLELVLEPGHFLAGQVVDERGNALAGVWMEPRSGWESAGPRVQTDADGRFRLEGLPASGGMIGLYLEGYVRQECAVVDVDRDDHVFTMQPCGRVAGKVVDGVTGLPITVFTIRFDWSKARLVGDRLSSSFDATWIEDGVRFESADGAWSSADELEIGTILAIEASAPGYGTARVERVVVERDPEPDALVLRLMPGAVLRGRVFTAGGEPLARAGICVLDAEAMDDDRFTSLADLDPVFTAEDGSFLLTDLEPGTAHLLVMHADWMHATVGPIVLASGDSNAEITVRMETGRALRGVVRDAAGAPIPDVVVLTRGRTGPNLNGRLRETVADAAGRFEIAHLTPGNYQVTAARAVGTRRETLLSVLCAVPADRDRELVLQPTGSATIRGKVVLDGPLPELQGPMHVSLRTPGQESEDPEAVVLLSRGTNVLDGTFTFENVEPGDYYYLEVNSWSRDRKLSLSARESVHVGEGEVLEVILKLVVTDL